jgi:hypothetical protein
MDCKTALEVKKSLLLLAEVLDLNPKAIAGRLAFLDDDKLEILKDAQKLWVAFDKASINERAEMLGIELEAENER